MSNQNNPALWNNSPLNSSKHLTRAQKDAIREYVSRASGERDRICRKEEVMREYHLTEGVVNALEAWIKIPRRQNRSAKTAETVQPMVSDALDNRAITTKKTSNSGEIFDIANPVGKTRLIATFRDVLHSEPELIFDQIETEAETYGVSIEAMELFVKWNIKGAHATIERARMDLHERDTRFFSEEEKNRIRTYVSEGKTEEEKKSRRRELAHEYHVSIQKIGAITAWTTIRENRASDPSDETVPTEAAFIALGEETDAMPIVSSLDTEFVQELANEYDLSNPKDREAFLNYVYDCFSDIQLKDVQQIIPELWMVSKWEDSEARIRSGEGMGALVNYNNEIKNKWRQKLKEFIDENTDPAKRASMKILCLPWVECREIPLYLELGFKPENIVGVEAGVVGGKKDPEVIGRFLANARQYGIQTRIGKLEKLMETEAALFDVISLDFLGPMSQTTLAMFNKMKLGERTLVLTNFLNKRENSIRPTFRKMARIFDPNTRSVSMPKDSPYFGIAADNIPSYSSEENVDVSFLKTHGGLWRTLSAAILNAADEVTRETLSKKIGTVLKDDDLQNIFKHLDTGSSHEFDQFSKHEVSMLIVMTAHKSFSRFLEDIWYPKDKNNWMHENLLNLILQSVVLKWGVLKHKTYRYKSSSSTMVSDFMIVQWTSLSKNAAFKRLTRFIYAFLEAIVRNSIREIQWESHAFKLKVKKYHPLVKQIHFKDAFVLMDNENEIGSILAGHFIEDLWAFQKHWFQNTRFSTETEEIK